MRKFILILALGALTLGCGDELDGEPEIVSMTISPDTVSASDTGMTDEFITVTIEVAGFIEPIEADDAIVFTQDPDRVEAEPGTREVNGNTLTLGMIAKTWLGGLDPGEYNVGAEVASSTQSVTQLDLATVTITK